MLLLLALCLAACPQTEDAESTDTQLNHAETDTSSSTAAMMAPTSSSSQDPTTSTTTPEPEDTATTTQGGGGSGNSSISSSSSGDDSSSESGETGGEDELCEDDRLVYCEDIAGICPDGPDGPLTNLQLLGYFAPVFTDKDLAPCYKGNPDDGFELARYLRIVGPGFKPNDEARFCLMNKLNESYAALSANPSQIAVFPGLPDEQLSLGEEKVVLYYSFCAADPDHQITGLTIHNDVGNGVEHSEALESIEINCSVGSLDNMMPSALYQLQNGMVQAMTAGCYLDDGTEGLLHVRSKASNVAGQFRLGIVEAQGAHVLGDDVFPMCTVE